MYVAMSNTSRRLSHIVQVKSCCSTLVWYRIPMHLPLMSEEMVMSSKGLRTLRLGARVRSWRDVD
jgi:hypothetical protein